MIPKSAYRFSQKIMRERYAFVRMPVSSLSCYRAGMNPVLEDAIVAIATTVGAWLFAQQLGALLYG